MTPAAYAMTLRGRLYGYGVDECAAWQDTWGRLDASIGWVLANCRMVPLDAEEASEVVEMLSGGSGDE